MGYSILSNLKQRITTELPIKLVDIPDSPDNVVVLREIPGINNTTENILEENRSSNIYVDVNVLVRMKNESGTYEAVTNLLDSIATEVSNLIFIPIGDKTINKFESDMILPIGVDKKNRYNASINLSIMYSRN